MKAIYSSEGATLLERAFSNRELTSLRWADWNPITKEAILSGADPMATYSGTKTFAERAVWEFAAEHPDLNITVCKCRFFVLYEEDVWLNIELQ